MRLSCIESRTRTHRSLCLPVSMGRQGVRSAWDEVPASVRGAVDALVGASVTTATNLDGGFSPGPAARCELSDGRTVFVKAAGLALNPESPGIHRREAKVLASMPSGVPAPQLLGVVDDGDWVAIVTEWIDGRMPVAPLAAGDVQRYLGVVERLADIEAHASLPTYAEVHSILFDHWQQLLDEPWHGLDTWTLDHLDELADLERGARDAVEGDRLVHNDLRTDNVIFAAAGPEHDVIVDWPGACRGAPWTDLVCILPSLELDGGARCAELFAVQPMSARAPEHAVTALLTAVAGYFTRMSLLPPPPGLPTVRAFQAAQGRIARRWLSERMGPSR